MLVFGQLAGNGANDLGPGDLRCRRPHHDSGDAFAEIGMGNSDDGTFQDAGNGVDLALDLLGIDVVAAGDNEILAAADDVDVAVRVDDAEVAGDEEAVLAKLRLGFFRRAPIAGKDIRTFDLDNADFTLAKRIAAVRVGDAQRNAGQREADRAGPTLALIGVRRVHVGLGHAVALENGVAGALAPGVVRFGEQRRRAGNEQADVLRRLGIQPVLLQEPGIEGRHPHQHCRAGQERDDAAGVEFLLEQHRGAGHQGDVGGDEQAVRVEDRQGMDQHVIPGETPLLDQHARIGGQVFVAEHGALGASGGARCVKDCGQIVRPARHGVEIRGLLCRQFGQRALTIAAKREGGSTRRVRQRRDSAGAGRVADDQPRLGITEEIAEFGQRVGGVERQEDRAGAQAGEVKENAFRAFFDLHGNAVARLDAEMPQRMCQLCRLRQHVAIGDRASVIGRHQDALGG
ncbi:hypothetical protein X766_01885 [Mesorhizobium sp. LSJC255A00]|nr:hypothetical protein X766_01885 [Mesorhizobium sp. LSJC255A00]